MGVTPTHPAQALFKTSALSPLPRLLCPSAHKQHRSTHFMAETQESSLYHHLAAAPRRTLEQRLERQEILPDAWLISIANRYKLKWALGRRLGAFWRMDHPLYDMLPLDNVYLSLTSHIIKRAKFQAPASTHLQ
jgi:hypothetical protein